MGERIPRIEEAPRSRHGYYEARPGDVVTRSDLRMVDVRPLEDLCGDFGHIHGVAHRSLDDLERAGLPGVHPREAVVVVCGNGHMSRRGAVALVQRHGFREVYHLVGGMLRWTAEERPVARVPTWRVFAGL